MQAVEGARQVLEAKLARDGDDPMPDGFLKIQKVKDARPGGGGGAAA